MSVPLLCPPRPRRAQDGSALVSVTGALISPLGPQRFEEVFVLSQLRPAEYYVANQVFRLPK